MRSPPMRDLAGVGAHQADDHVEAGRLAGAVRPEQADDLAAADGEVHVLDDLARAVAFLQAAGGQLLGLPGARAAGRGIGARAERVHRVPAPGVEPVAAFCAASVPARGASTAWTRPPPAPFDSPALTLKISVAAL